MIDVIKDTISKDQRNAMLRLIDLVLLGIEPLIDAGSIRNFRIDNNSPPYASAANRAKP